MTDDASLQCSQDLKDNVQGESEESIDENLSVNQEEFSTPVYGYGQ